MKAATRRPSHVQEITEWLRRGEVSTSEAFRLTMELKRRQAAEVGAVSAEARRAAEAEGRQEARAQAVLAELDRLVGLATVKQHVREIYAYRTVQRRRAAMGLAHEATGLHMVFTGNPGTGKTTVARLIGRLFREMGLLPQGHLVEVERADLVGEYIGHTALKTREVLKRATGGVLFIDEAYSLARGGEKDFGKESIDGLVRAMEEQRNELVIILAGYPAEMDWFLEQNPGLRSRLPLIIEFPDYSADELLAIAGMMWQERQYRLTGEAERYLQGLLTRPDGLGTGGDGNARMVRNLVEQAMRCQALRLVAERKPPQREWSKEELMSIEQADLCEALARERSRPGGTDRVRPSRHSPFAAWEM